MHFSELSVLEVLTNYDGLLSSLLETFVHFF